MTDDLARDLELMEHRLRETLLQALEARVGELKAQVLEDRRDYNRRIKDEVADLKQRIEELDELLRGRRGDNGLALDIKSLKEAEDRRAVAEDRRARWERLMVTALVMLVIEALWGIIVKGGV